MHTNMTFLKRLRQVAGIATAVAAMALVALAQDYNMYSGNKNRDGLPVDINAGAFNPNQYNNSGRNFLRWWDPVASITSKLDNDETSVTGTTTATGTWNDATLNKTVAFAYYQRIFGVPIYRYSALTKSTNADDQTQGNSGAYSFTFTGLSSTSNYEPYLNLPIGPTDLGVNPLFDLRFPQKYWVVKTSGIQGGDIIDVIEYDRHLGGFVRLGNNGNETSKTVQPVGTTITITLYNTAPINGNGTFLDPALNSDPTLLAKQVVYADGAQLISQDKAGVGNYTATPVVHRLSAPPIGNGAEPWPIRVLGSRTETSIVGDLNRSYELGVVTSYDYRGGNVPFSLKFRYNKIWSFPAKRAFDNSDAELTRYAREKRDWIMATGKDRTDQKVQADNLNGGSSSSAGFFATPGGAGNIGPDYLLTNAVTSVASEKATFGPNLPEGKYFIQVWLPGDNTLARQVQVNVVQGGITTDTLEFDLNGAQGWTTIPFQPATGYSHTDANNLQVEITNHTGNSADGGKGVYADAVRFVRQADLAIESTPVQTTTTIQTGSGPANRDVTIVGMENGRLYCMDAHGTNSGDPPIQYWTYPTEGTTDPNSTVLEDGKDRIAEMPMGFDLSSALVATVNGEDLLYIAGRNGKVYCLEMAGRGDGTTRRRWTYPDDYDPTNPTMPMPVGFRPIKGSIAYGVANGTPVIIIPTQEGRVIAVNALGNAATKRTSIVWQYPPIVNVTLGPITMTPVVANNRVYYGAAPTQANATGNIYALDINTGFPTFIQNGASIGGFAPFGNASPVAVPGSQLTGVLGSWDRTIDDTGNNRIFVCDSAGKFACLNALTGTIIWSSTELTTGAAGPLRFSYTAMYDNAGQIQENVPLVYVPDFGGRISGMSAIGNRNKNGKNRLWGYKLAGSNQVATLATGGFNLAANPHSWLYTGDSQGNFYAFNSIDNFNPFVISPGIQPGYDEATENDPGLDELNGAIDPNKFILISPEEFDILREKREDVAQGVTQADITNAVNNSLINRRHFEFGETLYVLVYDLPVGNGQNVGYYLDFEASSAGRPPIHRQQPLQPYSDNPNRQFALLGISLMTNGAGGVGPGANFLTAKAVAPANRGIQGNPVHLPKPVTFNPPVTADFMTANPLGLAFVGDDGVSVTSSICLNSISNLNSQTNPIVKIQTDPNNPFWNLFNSNGNTNTDQNPTGGSIEPVGPLGPDLRSKNQNLTHGGVGVQRMYVVDRSLMTLLLGRGLSGARVGPRDMGWIKTLNDPTGGVIKPLSANGVNLPGFEDYPIYYPNISADYPDIGRENLSMTSNLFGQAQNPLYVSGVDLSGPVYTANQYQQYRTAAAYENQMDRVLIPTIFDINLDVPRFQAPNKDGYYGSQVVFIDYQNNSLNFDPTQGAYRTAGIGLNIAIDERVVYKTPTIDLGSLPSGGGFNGGTNFGPFYPWDAVTLFSPWDGNYGNLFQPFVLENEGNVNLLNVRTAKFFFDQFGNRPVELFMPGQHELAWIDASLHLHSSLDPRFSSSRRIGPGAVGYDALGRNIIQKARPKDLTGTRFNVNPRSRPNSGLRIVGGYLYNQITIPPGDPKVGVSAPIGAPAGQYLRKIFAFEDSNQGNNVNADNPSLGTDEPFTEPGANLKFTIRESRLTNAPTQKSAPMVENVLSPNDKFGWSNSQPTAMRDGLGNVFVAWASNRIDAGGNAGWTPKQRVEADLVNQDRWRIYVGSLRSILGNTLGESPIGELNAFNPNAADRWFRQTLVIDPPVSVFNLQTGETLDNASVKFGAPVFGSSGFFNQLDFPALNGRQWFTGRYLSFLGEATKFDSAGNAIPISVVCLAPMVFNADGSITFNPGDIISSPFDITSKKSRPSMTVQHRNGLEFATVYTTTISNGNGQVTWHRYNPSLPIDQRFALGRLRIGSAFESIGSPSVNLHRYRNDDQRYQAMVSFTGKLKGRRYSDAYMLRLQADQNGSPRGRNPIEAYGTPNDPYLDELIVDPTSGIYWPSGCQLLNTDQTTLDQIDIGLSIDPTTRRVANSIWDGKTATRDFDTASGVLKFNSRLGGEVIIDTNTGAVRLNGAVLKRGTRLYIQYRPTIIRISEGAGSNYRSVASAYDDRFIGVRTNAQNPQRDLAGDLVNWVNSANNAAGPNDPLRWDRSVFAYTRTSGDGTAATRPYYQTMRYGVKLSYGIATRPNGTALQFEVLAWGTGVASEQYCQFDPATGRVFFLAGNEDGRVRIRYQAVDESGLIVGTVTEELFVRLIPEIEEQAVPIEQVGNESALSIALDPLNGTFNDINPSTGRRPGLLWMFWTSARNGQPDVFFETVAPRFSPRRADQ